MGSNSGLQCLYPEDQLDGDVGTGEREIEDGLIHRFGPAAIVARMRQ